MQNLRARGQSPRFHENTTARRAEEEGTHPATDLPRRHTNIRNRIREMMTSRDREGWWQSLFNANNSTGHARVLFLLAVLFTSALYFGKTMMRRDFPAGDGDGFPRDGTIDSSRNARHKYHHYKHETSKTVLKPTDSAKSHVLVTGGAGFIGSHGTLKLIEEGHVVTIVDNLSRGNEGALRALTKEISKLKKPKRSLRVIHGDLADVDVLNAAFETKPKVDKVIHFAAVAYVGESMADPNKYYKNVTSNTATLLQAMDRFKVNELIYSSTCATYGNPDVLPITEKTPTVPINPYGKSKLFAEEAIRDYAFANPEFRAVILRYFNVFGSDPKGRLGEYPRPELRKHGRISGACFDAALGSIEHLLVMGTNHDTRDGTCVRDFIHVTDLIDAHILAMEKATANPPSLYNVGTGRGVSVKEFVDACKKVTKVPIKVVEQKEARPGDYAEVYANVDKIEEELGWKARYVDLEESLGHAWKWRKKHPSGY
jgi:UDP-arabinose 4-epimerase